MGMKLKIKKGATVEVISGAEKGKKGTVLEILPGPLKVRVQGIRIQTHFDKKDGIQKKEGLIHYSNLRLVEGPASQGKTSKSKSKAGAGKKVAT
ncbi:MAG: KOW motif-containing protein [Bdellovibrionales bacterium]